MKVFVATRSTQGNRPSDQMECVEGELVWLLPPCPNFLMNPDGVCGCGRSFSGMSSAGLTTTAEVRDLEHLDLSDYAKALLASFEGVGWCPCCCERPVPEVIDELVALAEQLPVGAVVERRLDEITVRAVLA